MADDIPRMKDADEQTKERIKRYLTTAIMAAVVAFLLLNSVYNVSEQQQAVVTQFGKVIDIKTAGLYFKIPFIQEVDKVDTTTHGIPIGYTTTTGNESEGNHDAPAEYNESESLMITSDFNFVNIDFYLEYRVSNPEMYLYESENPEQILRNLAQAAIRQTVVNYTVDEVMTTGKGQIQAEVRDKLVASLGMVPIGLEVVNLTIQDVEPPTEAVISAFKDVESAKQGADTAINGAKKYQSEQLPAAEAEADKILQEAEAYKASRIAEAEGQVARFNEMYEQYKNYPFITKQRMFYEAMEDVLPGVKIIIDDGNTQTLLPLESFSTGDTYMSGSEDYSYEDEDEDEEEEE